MKRAILSKSDIWAFDASQVKPSWKLEMLKKFLFLKIVFI